LSIRPPPSSIATSQTVDRATNVTSNDPDVKGGNETDDWDGEDDFAETTNILSTRPTQPTYLDYPAGMVSDDFSSNDILSKGIAENMTHFHN
jgi:hypothetical protein